MAPQTAKTTLSYPLFAADFDPDNRGYLVVGGGGGESKSGVPNKISVLDTSNRTSITTVAEIGLSREEDSVQSLGNLARQDGLIAFAGINSSQADQKAGKNEHLRSFDIKYPPLKKQRTEKTDDDRSGTISLLGQRSIFHPSKGAKETYQRLLRLSPPQIRGSQRIGAVATGLAKDAEVVVFNATRHTIDDSDILTRISLPDGTQAEDLDIAEPAESDFSIAYCTEYDIFEQTYSYNFGTKEVKKTPAGPRRIYQMPFPGTDQEPNSRPKFRALRFLNSENVIALCNKPKKAGAELRIFHLYPTGPAALVLQKTLPSHMRQAVSLDVCGLDVDTDGNQQVVVAVAGQDVSIEIYTTNFQSATDTFSLFNSYLALRDVHPQQMTKLCFSPFQSPTHVPEPEPASMGANGAAAAEKQADPALHPGPQYVRLASISFGNTVVVHTFPLSPLEPQKKDSRYVLSHARDEAWTQYTYIAIISLMVLVVAFIAQSFVSGFSGDAAGPFSLLPTNVRDYLDKPAAVAYGGVHQVKASVSSVVDESLPSNMPGKSRLRELLATHHASADSSPKALVLRSDSDSGVSVDVHESKEEYLKQDADAKHWHELEEHQQAAWKERLVKAGEWVEGEADTVLLGVLFSNYAGLMGQMAQDALGAGS